MALNFERDETKANSNLVKHGIEFDEASTVFGDPASLTIFEPEHSRAENRFIILGTSHRGKLMVVVPPKEAIIFALSVHGLPVGVNERRMKKKVEKTESAMQAEYDFSSGARGKYVRRYAEGTNVVVLEPDVARIFPDADTVNRSLRALAQIIRRHEKSVPTSR